MNKMNDVPSHEFHSDSYTFVSFGKAWNSFKK